MVSSVFWTVALYFWMTDFLFPTVTRFAVCWPGGCYPYFYMPQKTIHSGQVAMASSLSLSLVWIAAAIAGGLALQESDSFPMLTQFTHLSGSGLVIGSGVSVAFAVYFAFRHSWRAVAATLSLSAFLGATACFLRFAGV